MPTMESIHAELAAEGKDALAARDPIRLERVLRCMIKYNIIQHEINELKEQADDLLLKPNIPTGRIEA